MNLSELVGFIAYSDGMLACSTGPLHIAAAFNKFTLGIFAPMHPIHPGRWAHLGKNAEFIVKSGDCNKCRKSKICECIVNIAPSDVLKRLIHFYNCKKI
jgi:heptosyltransferase III